MAREQEERERWAEEVEQMERTFSFLFLLPIHFRKISFHLCRTLDHPSPCSEHQLTCKCGCSNPRWMFESARLSARDVPTMAARFSACAAGGGRLWVCRLGLCSL